MNVGMPERWTFWIHRVDSANTFHMPHVSRLTSPLVGVVDYLTFSTRKKQSIIKQIENEIACERGNLSQQQIGAPSATNVISTLQVASLSPFPMPLINMFGKRSLFLIFFLRFFLLFRFLLWHEITKLKVHQFRGPKKSKWPKTVRSILSPMTSTNFFFPNRGMENLQLMKLDQPDVITKPRNDEIEQERSFEEEATQSTRSWNRITKVELVILLVLELLNECIIFLK